MMNVHEFMNSSTMFAFVRRSKFDYAFNSTPPIAVFLWRISTKPGFINLSVRTKHSPPIRRTFMATKMIFNILFKVPSRPFKFFTAKRATFNNPVSWSFPLCWAFVIAYLRAINPVITFKTYKFYIAYLTILCLALTHKANIIKGCEIDKDYFEAAVKRLKNHVAQTTLF